jgi:hypothetical protein
MGGAKKNEGDPIEHFLMQIPPDFGFAEIHGVSFGRLTIIIESKFDL